MTAAVSQDNYRLDIAAVVAAVVIAAALFAALWVINRAMGGMDEAKTLLHILFPIAAIPVYNSLATKLRTRSDSVDAVQSASHGYRSLFSSAFIVSLVVIVLFEAMSFLAGFTARVVVVQLYNGPNVPAMGFIAQAIGIFVTFPVIVVTCVVAGWLLARVRVTRPFRFAAYFAVSLFVLSLADAIVTVTDEEMRVIFQLNGTGDIIRHVAVATLARPLILSAALLLGFFIKYVWSSIFGGDQSSRQTAPAVAA
jgi:hypothetical protein